MTDMLKTAPEVKAPEIKGMPETVTAAFEEFMEAFEAFKDVNDRRLGEIEQKLTSDVVTRDKMDRINRAMDEQKKVLDQMLLKKARPALGCGHDRELSPEAEEHKAAFDAYVRRGEDAGLRELEAKAFSATAGADGGYLVPPETDNEIGRRISIASPMRALSTVRTVSSAVLKKPFAASGLSTGWVAETAARPQTSTPQLSELSFPTMELYAMPAATQALLDDAAVDIEAWIAGEVDIVFAEQEGDAFIRGDGVNKPRGFLKLYGGGGIILDLGQSRLRRDRHRRGLEDNGTLRHAGGRDLCAEGRAPPERHLHDEPQDASRRAKVQGCRRQLSVAPAGKRRSACLADGFPDRRGRGDAGRRRQCSCRRLRRLPLRLSRGRPGGRAHPARSLFGQALCAFLHHQARRRRSAELRGDQAD